MIEEAIYKLSKRENLTEELLKESFTEIIEGKASQAQIAAFLMGLSMKGETENEILATVKLFREHSIKINAPENAIDIVGTGGDKAGTFNVSTATCFIVAAAGIPVAKHGNRSASSLCGSIDVLEELGVKVDFSPEQAERCLHECGMTILFAPLYHPAMKAVAQVRRELKIRTIFNILGPMLNPAQVRRQLIGVFSGQYMEVIAKVLLKLGSKDIMVVHSEDGLDEITVTADTHIIRGKDNKIESFRIRPEDYGFKKVPLEKIKGGDRRENARIILDILRGQEDPKTNMVLLNSAAALMLSDKVKDLKEGIEYSRELIYSGKAYKKFEQIREFTNRL